MRRDDKKGRSGRNKFPATDKRILQGQTVKEGDVEKKLKRGAYKRKQECKTGVVDVGKQRYLEQSKLLLNGNICGLLCC